MSKKIIWLKRLTWYMFGLNVFLLFLMGYAYFGQPESGWGVAHNSFIDGFMSAFLEKLLNRPSPPHTLYYPLFVSAYNFGKLIALFLFPTILYGLAIVFIKGRNLYLLRGVLTILIILTLGRGGIDIFAGLLLFLTSGQGPKDYFKSKAR